MQSASVLFDRVRLSKCLRSQRACPLCGESVVSLQAHLCPESPLVYDCHDCHAGKPSVVQLLNYKKNGDPFMNYLSITPIHDSRGHVTHFVGIQSDISDLVNHKKAELAAKHEAAQASHATSTLFWCPGTGMLWWCTLSAVKHTPVCLESHVLDSAQR